MKEQPPAGPDEENVPDRAEEWFTIGNEFAFVKVRKVHTRNGERLQINAPKMGFDILLDAVALESISWQPPETFSKFLETPFGPEGTSSFADKGNPLDNAG